MYRAIGLHYATYIIVVKVTPRCQQTSDQAPGQEDKTKVFVTFFKIRKYIM